ncbi:hypothetical protein [Rhodococcus ruber]|uniref:hypothetical protein n=1 Tax=Rhodococcus ruber TaxID=1830 RepID=UPI003D81511E
MSEIPEGWRQVKLGDMAQEVTVGHVGSMAREYSEGGVIFLRSQNVVPHGFDLTDVRYIPVEFHETLRKSSLRPGDVVTVRTGKPGATAVVPQEWTLANCADLVITRPGPSINAHWLSYFINSVVEGFVSSRLVGAVQQHFNVGAARDMDLLLPSLDEQRAIADVLGALDGKIVADRKLIETARKLAVLWLHGAASASLADLVEHRRTSQDPAECDAGSVAHFSLPAFDERQRPERVSPGEIKSAKFRITAPSVLISKLNPRFPRVWDVMDLPNAPSFASTEFLVLEPKYSSTSVLWAALSQPTVGHQLESMVAGTSGSHQRVKPADILNVQVADPRRLDGAIAERITNLARVVHNAREESETLAALRDTLLPRLMSGELRVKDAEAVVADAV